MIAFIVQLLGSNNANFNLLGEEIKGILRINNLHTFDSNYLGLYDRARCATGWKSLTFNSLYPE